MKGRFFMFKNIKKNLDLNKDKKIISSILIFFSLYFAFSCTYVASAAQSVREEVVRLHILANTDSEFDQRIKLEVRDALLETNASILTEKVIVENAKEYFEESKDELMKAVEKVLRENGVDYGATINLQIEYYETREYGDLTFPAGEYLSLKIVLGKGEGKNWWCVMFPPLCVPCADDVSTDESKTSHYLTDSGDDVVNGGEKYVVKFKIIEFYEELKQKFK
jgi:stage II sporulation protein R